MKRLWAVLLTALALVGCRSSQPATNPFLRTTVPPPATAPAVVTPGEPFTPGVVPQAAPPVVAPAVPVMPAPAAPPPVVVPPKDKFSPPGGSFQYNQSSIDRSQGGARPGSVSLASYQGPAGQPSSRPAAAEPPREPAVAPAFKTVSSASTSTIRILPPASGRPVETSSAESASAPTASPDPVMRVTAEDGRARDAGPEAASEAAAESSARPQVAIVAPDSAADSVEAEAEGEWEGEVAEEPDAEKAGYAFSPDYGWLRGRLEYSHTSRQWKLRYIPIDGQTDQYGGSVKLPASQALAAYKPGDMVAVRGALASGSTTSGSFAPLYELAHIEPLVR